MVLIRYDTLYQSGLIGERQDIYEDGETSCGKRLCLVGFLYTWLGRNSEVISGGWSEVSPQSGG